MWRAQRARSSGRRDRRAARGRHCAAIADDARRIAARGVVAREAPGVDLAAGAERGVEAQAAAHLDDRIGRPAKGRAGRIHGELNRHTIGIFRGAGDFVGSGRRVVATGTVGVVAEGPHVTARVDGNALIATGGGGNERRRTRHINRLRRIEIVGRAVAQAHFAGAIASQREQFSGDDEQLVIFAGRDHRDRPVDTTRHQGARRDHRNRHWSRRGDRGEIAVDWRGRLRHRAGAQRQGAGYTCVDDHRRGCVGRRLMRIRCRRCRVGCCYACVDDWRLCICRWPARIRMMAMVKIDLALPGVVGRAVDFRNACGCQRHDTKGGPHREVPDHGSYKSNAGAS